MKIAVLADIHSNLEALTACLAHARAQGAEQYAVLGDLVGYGADPCACLEVIAELARNGAWVVRGNHDEAALGGLCETMAFVARDAIYWTREQLTQQERDFLRALPLSVQNGNVLYTHACSAPSGQRIYLTGAAEAARCMAASGQSLTFIGHVHHQTLYFTTGRGVAQAFTPPVGVAIPLTSGRRWLAIAGAVGQQRDGNPAAAYVIHDLQRETLSFFRVPYDYWSAARKVRAAGLPERLALRLESGH
jgi:predicted phosphodiesterase